MVIEVEERHESIRPLGAIDIQGMTWSLGSLVRLTCDGNEPP